MKSENRLSYEELELEVIPFDTEDIIRASNAGDLGDEGDADAIKPPVSTFDF